MVRLDVSEIDADNIFVQNGNHVEVRLDGFEAEKFLYWINTSTFDGSVKSLKSEIISWLQGTANLATKPGRFVIRIILIASTPVALVGWILNSLPFYTAKWIAESKVGKIEFRYPVRMGIFLVLGLIYYLLIALILVMIYWPGIFALVIIPALGYFSIIWLEEWRRLTGRMPFAPTGLKS